MKITKADFPGLVDFTQNLDEGRISPYIDIAFQRDVTPKIGESLADLITMYDPTQPNTATAALFAAVRPYWVFAAYVRHLLVHGIFHTQAGLTTPTPDRSEQISDKRRAEIMSAAKSDMYFFEGEMMKHVKVNYPAEGGECAPARKKSRIGLRVVGAERSKASPVTYTAPPVTEPTPENNAFTYTYPYPLS